MLAAIAALYLAVVGVGAHPVESRGMVLPTKWYRDANDGHPVHKLFARQSEFPQVGSPEWTKKYPAGKLSAASNPQEWTDALAAAKAAGKIPTDCPVASAGGTYRNSSGTINPNSPQICSSAAQCRSPDQVYDVPDNIVAISFDDGPQPASKTLHEFCRQNNQKVTHFYIGGNIRDYPQLFMEAYSVNGDDMAVHTWSHQHTPQLTDDMVLAELGWTVQIIFDSTGGRLPMYWRPPYGESDTRVRAIAYHVFGLKTVIWNNDTDDWKIGQGQTFAKASAVLTKAYTGKKSPGLNILEHELTEQTVKVFTDTYPMIAQNGWTGKSIPDALGSSWYLNAADNTSPVTPGRVAGGPGGSVAPPSPSGGNSSATDSASTVGPSATAQPGSNGALSLIANSITIALVTLLGSILVL